MIALERGSLFLLLACASSALGAETFGIPVADDELDTLRGGFEISSDLKVSFGVERAAYVNGELITKNSVVIPDLSAITPEQATALDQAINGVVLIQNGPNNSYDVASAAAGATIIQNTLNDQHIVTLTTINADVNSLGALRDIAAQESLQSALNKAVGVR